MNNRKFNLRKALMGYPLRTRDGHKALLTGVLISTKYPLIGVVAAGDDILQFTWNLDGKWTQFSNNSNNDLLMD